MGLNKEQTLALLKKGAKIEFTSWGIDCPIYIRLGELYQKVNRSAFNGLAHNDIIKQVKQDKLTQTWILAKLQAGKETESQVPSQAQTGEN